MTGSSRQLVTRTRAHTRRPTALPTRSSIVALRPGSVRFEWTVAAKPGDAVLGATLVPLKLVAIDDGSGNLIAVSAGGAALSGTLGTINYTTGAAVLKAHTVQVDEMSFPHYRTDASFRLRVDSYVRAAINTLYTAGTPIIGSWQSASAADTLVEDLALALPAAVLQLTKVLAQELGPRWRRSFQASIAAWPRQPTLAQMARARGRPARAARRAARGPMGLEVPRIVRRADGVIGAPATEGVFDGIGLADHHRAGRPELRQNEGIGLGGRCLRARARSGARRMARKIDDVLDADRQAGERAFVGHRFERLGFRERRLVGDDEEGIELRVVAGDCIERPLDGHLHDAHDAHPQCGGGS